MQNAVENTENIKSCAHCGLECNEIIQDNDRIFCCLGCRTVWNVLNSKGLSAYYSVRDKLKEKGFTPIYNGNSTNEYLDDILYLSKKITDTDHGISKVRIYVPEVYCGACIWLLERLPNCEAGIKYSRLSLSNKILEVDFSKTEVTLSKIVSLVSSFGYTPQVLDINHKPDETYKNEDLSRLAVAVFSAMNCMMIAVSLYQGWWTGMNSTFKFFLELVSAIIALPAITYSALPFIKRAIAGIRVGKINLDFPLAFGIVVGYVLSLFGLIFGWGEVYFDSITVLVALLLVARYANNFTLEKFKRQGNMIRSVFPENAVLINSETKEAREVFVERLKVGDLCLLSEGVVVPADGVLEEGEVLIDSSVLSGEVDPVKCAKGSFVWAGTKVVQGNGKYKVNHPQENSRFYTNLDNLSQNIELGSELMSRLDRRSTYFVAWVMLVASCSFLFHCYSFGFVRAYEVALSIFVISCPCALGISVPFVFTSACLKAAKYGIYFASGGSIERLAKAKTMVFDKTGTLTEGAFSDVEMIVFSEVDELNLLGKVYQLEYDKLHPIAKRLSSYIADKLKDLTSLELLSQENQPGSYVSGSFNDGDNIFVGSRKILEKFNINIPDDDDSITKIYVVQNGLLKLEFRLRDKIRPGMRESLSRLAKHGLSLIMLSGDRMQVVNQVGADLGFLKSNIYAQKSPEEKRSIVSGLGREVVMIGDGINDIQALKVASLGISVTGGLDLLQKVGGASILDFSSSKLMRVYLGSLSSYRAAKLNISFSFCYNLFGTLVAAFGYVSPLIAAILMPISSVIVVLISIKGPNFEVER